MKVACVLLCVIFVFVTLVHIDVVIDLFALLREAMRRKT